MLLAAASRSTNVWCGSVSSILLRSNARQLQSSCTWLHAKQFSSEESPFQKDKSLHYVTQKESEYKLGKHRSNALSLIEAQPVIEVEGNMAVCDGGGGALGHPLEYIRVMAGKTSTCIYCGLKYTKKV